jgi:hypothetical protein
MLRSIAVGMALLATAAGAASAQSLSALTLEPYVAYGFFGSLPEGNGKLEADIAYGGRVGYQMSPQWSLFGNFQRSTPSVAQGLAGIPFGTEELNVDHWSAGVEFAYAPRGGAEGLLPVLMEAGVGQARYEGGTNDFGVNIGIASAFRFSPNLSIRYGVNDYISNYSGDAGVVNQIFARIGVELSP